MTNFENDHNSDFDELYWTAFTYVAGELPPSKQSEFELRLANDQTAREVVEWVVAEMQILHRAIEPLNRCDLVRSPAESTNTLTIRKGYRHRHFLLAWTTSAAILLIGVLLYLFISVSKPDFSAHRFALNETTTDNVDNGITATERALIDRLLSDSDGTLWITTIVDWNFEPSTDEFDQRIEFDDFLVDFDEPDFCAAGAVEELDWMIEAFHAAADEEKIEFQPLGFRDYATPHVG